MMNKILFRLQAETPKIPCPARGDKWDRVYKPEYDHCASCGEALKIRKIPDGWLVAHPEAGEKSNWAYPVAQKLLAWHEQGGLSGWRIEEWEPNLEWLHDIARVAGIRYHHQFEGSGGEGRYHAWVQFPRE